MPNIDLQNVAEEGELEQGGVDGGHQQGLQDHEVVPGREELFAKSFAQ